MGRSQQWDLSRELNTKKMIDTFLNTQCAALQHCNIPPPPPFPEPIISPWKTMNPNWEVLAFLGSAPVNDLVKVLKLRTGGMCGVPPCTGVFVSEQPFCRRGNLLCHFPRWMLAYLRRPAENINVGQREQRVSSYWATHTHTFTYTHSWVDFSRI